jgi:hypothetical protein
VEISYSVQENEIRNDVKKIEGNEIEWEMK